MLDPLVERRHVAKQRNDRQEAIRQIIRDKSIRTQRALVEELQAQGFSCTQATVSPGTASGVAAASDGAALSHALGSVAGNDTVLVVAVDGQHAADLQALVKKLGSSSK